MGKYHGALEGITPNTSNDNWALDAAAGEMAKIEEIRMSGEVTTTTAMRTKVQRSSAGATPTPGTPGKLNPRSPANLVDFVTAWGTQPTLTAGGIVFNESWNAHGGIVRWLAAPEEEIYVIGAEQISCRNGVGTGASSYEVVYSEP